MTQGPTKVAQVLVPEVLGNMISHSLQAKLKFTPLAEVDTTLVGQPGDTITVPKWEYIGPVDQNGRRTEVWGALR